MANNRPVPGGTLNGTQKRAAEHMIDSSRRIFSDGSGNSHTLSEAGVIAAYWRKWSLTAPSYWRRYLAWAFTGDLAHFRRAQGADSCTCSIAPWAGTCGQTNLVGLGAASLAANSSEGGFQFDTALGARRRLHSADGVPCATLS